MNHTIENQPAALARREDIVVQEMPDEVLVYDLKQHKAHCLNKTAAFIWDHCDGQRTPTEIAVLMEKKLHKSINDELVWLALQQLGKANLLQDPLVNLGRETRFSRRAVIRKLGLGAAVAIPLVTTIVAPLAAQAATGNVCVPGADIGCTGCQSANGAQPACTTLFPNNAANEIICVSSGCPPGTPDGTKCCVCVSGRVWNPTQMKCCPTASTPC